MLFDLLPVVRLTSSMLWETERKVLIHGCTCGLMAVLFSSASPSCRARQRPSDVGGTCLSLPFLRSLHPVSARASLSLEPFLQALSEV